MGNEEDNIFLCPRHTHTFYIIRFGLNSHQEVIERSDRE